MLIALLYCFHYMVISYCACFMFLVVFTIHTNPYIYKHMGFPLSISDFTVLDIGIVQQFDTSCSAIGFHAFCCVTQSITSPA